MTPAAPWYAEPPGDDGYVDIMSPFDQQQIALVYRPENAPVVESAPLLLIALERLVNATLTDPDDFNVAFAFAQSVLANARPH